MEEALGPVPLCSVILFPVYVADLDGNKFLKIITYTIGLSTASTFKSYHTFLEFKVFIPGKEIFFKRLVL